MDPQALYVQLGNLVAEMPYLGGTGPITPEMNRWLGRAAILVEAAGMSVDLASLRLASNTLTVARDLNAQTIQAIVVSRARPRRGERTRSARGAFVGVGAAFDALQVVAKVLTEVTRGVLIVDPYLDATALTDFAPQAPPGVAIRLLADSFYTKPDALAPAATRWGQQFGTARPLEVRLSAPRALHDRLIINDGAKVWTLTQSLKNFATRSPALVQRVDPEIAAMKVAFYDQIWNAATAVP